MAVWDFNIGWVYKKKPRVPFSAKFHRCFKTRAEAVVNNPTSPFLKGRTFFLKMTIRSRRRKTVEFWCSGFKALTERPWRGCTCGLFHDWIIYRENERHATCVPNVSVCATGRSPALTSKSGALLQLRVAGNWSVSWAWSFSLRAGQAGADTVVLTGNQTALKPSRALNRNFRGIECVCFLWFGSLCPFSRFLYLLRLYVQSCKT